MSLNSALRLLLEEYPEATEQEIKGNAVANFIRDDIPEFVKTITNNNQRYVIQGSPGKGNWAAVPWVAVLDNLNSG